MRYSYSNSGYLLLSEIVKRASGKSLRDVAAERIFTPLGMTSTQFHDNNARIVERRAEGYQPSGAGGFEIVRTSFALVGDGGLLTTVEDLRKWDSNFYANRLGKGDAGFTTRLATAPSTPLGSGKAQTYAFGLMPMTYRGLPVVDHGGAFIGFRADLLRFPTEHFSVAVLCNDYTAAPEQLARRVADKYLADRLAPAVSAAGGAIAGVAVPAERLERWAGRYEVLPGIVATIAREGTGMVMSLMGTRMPLEPTSDSTLRAAEATDSVVFSNTPAGPTVRVTQFDMPKPTLRLASPPVVTAATATAFTGRYTSAELDTWAVIQHDGAALKVRTRYGPWMPLMPMAPDVFGVPAGAKVAFTRDKRGAVTGFSLSQARTNNLGFTRQP
jgi:hypothetical protein